MEKNEQFKVWFASSARINSYTKWVVFDDYGIFLLEDDEISFQGKKHSLKLLRNEIEKIYLIRQKINWTSYLIVNLVAICFLLFFLKMSLAIVIPLMVLSSLFGIIIGSSTKWVCLDLKDSRADDNKVHFAVSSFFGWGGIFGGTKRLFEKLNNKRTVQK